MLAEVYDPETGKVTSVGSMSVARCYGAAALLADGRVLMTGGRHGSTLLASGEVYQP